MDNNKFKQIVCKLKFNQIKIIFSHIKYDNKKYKLLINGINEKLLNNLINFFESYDYDFLCKNYNFILQL